MTQQQLPTAELKPQRRWSLAWLIPLAALILAGWLAWSAWSARGVTVEVQFDHGHGLEPGAAVRYRGTIVGAVRDITLSSDGQSITTTLALHKQADVLARTGSRFWIVRPQIELGEVEGLETIIGARYIAALPGDGPPQHRFVGLPEPPVVEWTEPGDLEVVVKAPARMGLRRGAPVLYRQIRIGAVLSVGLTSDGGAVEARLHIEGPYVPLIRPETRFWPVSGIKADVGISGVRFEAESLQTILNGGIALATPPDAGPVVTTGHRYELDLEPDEDWLQWQPQVAIGRHELPPGAVPPPTARLKLVWEQGRIGPYLSTRKSRQGWGLYTSRGLLAPLDLLTATDKAEQDTIALETAGRRFALSESPDWTGDKLALVDIELDMNPWPADLLRHPTEPEDALVITDHATTPLPLAASRFTPAEDGGWAIDPAISIDQSWHGATVVARSDGKVIGLVLVDEDDLRVALIPDALLVRNPRE